MIEAFIRWLIKRHMPEYHLRKTGKRKLIPPTPEDAAAYVSDIVTSDGLSPTDAYDYGKECKP
jgi:hypothetical protein